MSQSKVRVLLVEADGVDSSLIAEALRSFGLAQIAPTPPISPAIEIPAPAASGRALAPPAVEPAASPEVKPQRQVRTKRAVRKSAALASPAPAASALQDAEEEILAELRKGERTIKHLMDSTGLTYASVFGALKRLESRGKTESKKVDGDTRHIHRLIAG